METRYIVGINMCSNVGAHLNLLMPCTSVKQKINLMMLFCFLDEEEDDAEKAR
jgi:hypothetical protein